MFPCWVIATTLLTAAAVAQDVSVTVTTSKPAYLAGEPVWVVVEAKNVGADPIGYSDCDGHAQLTVNHDARPSVNLRGCFSGTAGSGLGCGIDHPPLFGPGKSVSFRYLLKGYDLPPGDYTLHAVGRAGVRWKYYPGPIGPPQPGTPPPPPPPLPKHQDGDPVVGAEFDVQIPLTVAAATEEELRHAYEPYFAAADSRNTDVNAMRQARETIAELAVPQFERVIADFATGEKATPPTAVEGLRKIHTPESRRDLIALFHQSGDLQLRIQIANALAEQATSEELTFLAGLLPGYGEPMDDNIRHWAALGLGLIGGDSAAQALSAAPAGGANYREAVAIALGNTKSASAVLPLIRMFGEGDPVRNSVCGALVELTHYRFCDGSDDPAHPGVTQAKWARWWFANASNIEIHGKDACPVWNATLPQVP